MSEEKTTYTHPVTGEIIPRAEANIINFISKGENLEASNRTNKQAVCVTEEMITAFGGHYTKKTSQTMADIATQLGLQLNTCRSYYRAYSKYMKSSNQPSTIEKSIDVILAVIEAENTGIVVSLVEKLIQIPHVRKMIEEKLRRGAGEDFVRRQDSFTTPTKQLTEVSSVITLIKELNFIERAIFMGMLRSNDKFPKSMDRIVRELEAHNHRGTLEVTGELLDLLNKQQYNKVENADICNSKFESERKFKKYFDRYGLLLEQLEVWVNLQQATSSNYSEELLLIYDLIKIYRK